MGLIPAAFEFFSWLQAVIREFVRVNPLNTAVVVTASVLAQVTNLLAFFLPLKIVLLAGSPGVPSYFQGFISMETRIPWIIGLAVGAASLFFVSTALEVLARRHAVRGSSQVLQEATRLALIKNQDAVAEGYYSSFCRAYASLIFSGVLLMSGLVLYFPLFAFVFLVILALFATSGWIIGDLEAPRQTRYARYILNQTTNYLSILSAAGFIAVFAFLMTVYLGFDGVNVLIALLSIFIARQLFQNLASLTREAIRLTGSRETANALIFAGHHHDSANTTEIQSFLRLFEPTVRVKRMAAMLGVAPENLTYEWIDTPLTGVAAFRLSLKENVSGIPNACSELVYFPSSSHVAENEMFLLRQVPRQPLGLPRLIRDYRIEGFEGRIFWGDASDIPSLKDWPAIRRTLLVRHWSYEPPRELLDAYAASRPLLHHRMNESFVRRVALAVGSTDEQRILDEFLDALPDLGNVIASMPLFVFNPHVSRGVVFAQEDGTMAPWGWGRWSLEPVGVGIERTKAGLEWLESSFPTWAQQAVRFQRTSPLLMRIADDVWHTERLIQKRDFKSALSVMEATLSLFRSLDSSAHHTARSHETILGMEENARAQG